MTRLIVPNYHVILIHFPLALLSMGLFLEICYCCCKRGSLRVSARGMILIGALALTPAATAGIAALQDVLSHGAPQSESWQQLAASSGLSSTEWELVKDHVLLGGFAAGLALIAVILWLAGSDPWHDRIPVAVFLTFITALALSTVGAWQGGEMVFRQGFGVDGRRSVLMNAPNSNSRRDKIDNLLQPGQLHIIMAGVVFATAAAGLGLSMRRSAVLKVHEPTEERPVHAAATYLAMPTPSIADNAPLETRLVEPPPVVEPPKAAKFWLIVALLALVTILGGFYFGDFMIWPQIIDWPRVKDQLHSIMTRDERRMGLHIAFGASILILSLVLAIAAKWAPRSSAFFSVVSLLLIFVMAAQVWIGTLLLFDGGEGRISGFNNGQPMMPATMPSNEPSTEPSTHASDMPQ